MTGKLIIFWSLVIWFAIVWVWLFGGPGFLFWGAALVVIAMAFSRQRQAKRDALVQMLALAGERQMPLAPLAAAFGQEAHYRRFAALAQRLEAGEPLWQALNKSGNISSPALAVAAIVGERTGAVGPALGDAARTRRWQVSFWNAAGEQMLYVCMLALVALMLLTFYTLKIVPVLVRIFDDYGTQLPPLTKRIIQFSLFAAESGLAVGFGIALVVVILLVLGYYVGWVHFRVPVLDRFTNRLHVAAILRALALPVERQQSFEAVLIALSCRHPSHSVRRKLKRAVDDMDAGRQWVDALRGRGLIRAVEATLLASAERIGNLGWALRETADSIERKLAYRLRMLSQVLFPLAVLAIGAAVMMFVVGYFLPLVQLINNLSF